MKFKLKYQVLATEVTVFTDDENIYNAFLYTKLEAEQTFEIAQKLIYKIKIKNGLYTIYENEKIKEIESDAVSLVNELFKEINTRCLDFMDTYIRIHSGSASYKGKYFLIVGDAYAGKSTFMTSLAFDDFDVHGDELSLLKNQCIITYPRKMYIRDTSLFLIPKFEKIHNTLPFVWNTETVKIFAFDPSVIGKKWNIAPKTLSAIFFIHKNHDGESYLKECPKYKMAQQVISQSTAPIKRDRNWVGDICNTLNNAKTFDLHLGNLDGAKELIKKVIV